MKKTSTLGLIQLLVIPLIIAIFSLPGEKRWLSLAANFVFLGISFLTITYSGHYKNWIRFLGIQFFLTSVLPIIVLRIISWDRDFSTESLFGFTGNQWHSFSNKSYLLMVAGTLGFSFYLIIKKSSSPRPG